jgi:regulatory protein
MACDGGELLVTAIEPSQRGRCRIFINEEFAFTLYRNELPRYDIEAGASLSGAAFREIREHVRAKRARSRAFHLLAKRRYTEKQLRQKLEQGEYPADIIDGTLEYLLSLGYIDDASFVRDYIDYHRHNKSLCQLRQELSAKGIPFEITDSIYAEMVKLDDGTSEESEEKQILWWLEKKKFNKNTADFREKQRIFAFLCRKGFQIDSIRRIILLDME